jgi:hypothetical protein
MKSSTRVLPRLILLLGFACVCGVMWLYPPLQVGGKNLPAEKTRIWLTAQLQKHFGWSALPAASVERAWATGFQNYTWLFRIRLAPDKFSDLRRAVLATQGNGITSDDRDDLSLCPYRFTTTSPMGVGKKGAPTWWEAASLQHFDSILWQAQLLDYWFCYDTDRQLLFLLVHH